MLFFLTVGMFFKKPCNTITYNQHFFTLETNLDESSCFTTLKILLKCHHAGSVSFLKVIKSHTWMSFLISLGSQPRLLLPFPRRRRCHVGTLKFRSWEWATRGGYFCFNPWNSKKRKRGSLTISLQVAITILQEHSSNLLTCFPFSMSHHPKGPAELLHPHLQFLCARAAHENIHIFEANVIDLGSHKLPFPWAHGLIPPPKKKVSVENTCELVGVSMSLKMFRVFSGHIPAPSTYCYRPIALVATSKPETREILEIRMYVFFWVVNFVSMVTQQIVLSYRWITPLELCAFCSLVGNKKFGPSLLLVLLHWFWWLETMLPTLDFANTDLSAASKPNINASVR